MYTYLYILSEEDPEDNMSARADNIDISLLVDQLSLSDTESESEANPNNNLMMRRAGLSILNDTIYGAVGTQSTVSITISHTHYIRRFPPMHLVHCTVCIVCKLEGDAMQGKKLQTPVIFKQVRLLLCAHPCDDIDIS